MAFSNEQLADLAGVDPWKLHAQLAAGSPAEIDSLASAFYQAGGQAAEAQASARSAQRYVAAGYSTDGGSPVNDSAEVARVQASLGNSSDHLPRIGRLLVAVADELDTATTRAAGEITGLDGALARINAEWTSFVQQIGHHLPPDDQDAARQGFLQQAVDAVGSTGKRIDALLTDYETTLARQLKTLSDLGYTPPASLDDFPGDVGLSSEQATSDADAIRRAERDGGPSAEAAAQNAEQTVALLDAKVKAGGRLTAAEQVYLDRFLTELGPQGLSGLPKLGADSGAGTSVVTPVADAIMNLSRPEGNADGKAHVPAVVTALASPRLGYQNDDDGPLVWANANAVPGHTDHYSGMSVDGLDQYNGFAALMAASSVTGGTDFTKQLADGAISVKQQLNTVAADEVHALRYGGGLSYSADPSHPTTTKQLLQQLQQATGDAGVGTMLSVVGRNEDASALVLLDTHDRQAILGLNWDAAQSGAGSIVTGGTDRNVASTQAQALHATAALAVIKELGGDRGAYRAHVTPGVNAAVLDMTNQYIDAFAYPVDAKLQHSAVDQSIPGISGGSFVGLVLDRDDSSRFLEYVMHDPANSVKLQAAASAWSQQQLTAAFRTGSHDAIGSMVQRAGALDGALTTADMQSRLDGVANADDQAKAQYAADQDRAAGIQIATHLLTGATAATIGAATGGTGGVLASLGATSINELVNHLTGPGAPPQPELPGATNQQVQYQAAVYTPHRDYLIVSAATAAGVTAPNPGIMSGADLVPESELGANKPWQQVDLDNALQDLQSKGVSPDAYNQAYSSYAPATYIDDRAKVPGIDDHGWDSSDDARSMLYGGDRWKISYMPEVDYPDDPAKIYVIAGIS